MTILDRILGRTPPPDAKAATGPGVWAMSYGTPLTSFSSNPHKLMAEAQALFHTNWTVHAAESVIGNKLKTTPWHLEDEDGETVDENSREELQAIWRLLMRPNPNQTRNQMWSLTGRHEGLAGNAFWYLDQRDARAGTPLQLLYINPCRMTPTQNAAGRVVGWTLDHPDNQVVNAYDSTRREGVPLDVEEVLHFRLDEPDSGVWGIGVAESAQRLIQLSRLIDGHASGVLSSGGRLSGLITPKAQTAVGPDEWVQFVRDWRSITSDPDAAKRLQIAKMPLDFTQMTVSPKELQLLDVSKSTVEDILTAWQVPPTQLGRSKPAGMNSGETQGYDEASLSQGAVQPRGDQMAETIQVGLLDRWADAGIKVRLVIEWPQFDDESPLYENANKARVIPLTINQRLESVGKDPLDEAIYGPLGTAIYIDQSMVPIFDPVGGGGGSALPPPAGLIPPGGLTPPPSTEATGDETDMVKGRLSDSLGTLRSRIARKWEPRFQRVAKRVLRQQLELAQSHAAHMARKPSDTSWWNEDREKRRWLEAIDQELQQFGREVADKSRSLARVAKAEPMMYEQILNDLKVDVGARITNINETTRDSVRETIGDQIRGGELTDPSPAGLADIIEGSVMQNGQPVFGELRSETIARTETAHLYNQATLASYKQMGVEEVEAIDGDHDEECAARNGTRFLASEAVEIEDHPNGTLDWIPVIGELAATPAEEAAPAEGEAEVTERMDDSGIFQEVPEWAKENGFEIDHWDHLPLDQRQKVLEAIEDLKRQGFTSKIATGGKTKESGGELVGAGNTVGRRIELDVPTNNWDPNAPAASLGRNAGDTFRHEYGHMVLEDDVGNYNAWLSKTLDELGVDINRAGRSMESAKVEELLSPYANLGGNKEFVAEYFAKFTSKGYKLGTLPNDREFIELLKKAGVYKP